MKYYFTFGCGQPNANGYHVIEAPTYDVARAEMYRRFGQKWSMQYTEAEWSKDHKTQADIYHLHEVK